MLLKGRKNPKTYVLAQVCFLPVLWGFFGDQDLREP